jgi:hypothetical protein
MGLGEPVPELGVDLGLLLQSFDAPGAFETGDTPNGERAGQPIQSRERSPVVEDGGDPDHDRKPEMTS